MLKSLLTHTKHLLISSTIAISSVYGYCWYRAYNNEKQYLMAINADTLKDASRLTNQSFGISWGFQADDTVMNNIDSGDIFFIKYDCLQTLDPVQMIQCYLVTIPLLDQQYHTIGILSFYLGVAYRDQNGLMSYFNQFGHNKLMRYSQFVSLPYIKQLMVQKTPLNIHNKLVKLLQQDKAFDQISQQTNNVQNKIKTKQNQNLSINNQNKQSNQVSKIINKIRQIISPNQDTYKFVNRVLKRINIIDQNQVIYDIRQLLTNQKQVNIRTQTNKILRSL